MRASLPHTAWALCTLCVHIPLTPTRQNRETFSHGHMRDTFQQRFYAAEGTDKAEHSDNTTKIRPCLGPAGLLPACSAAHCAEAKPLRRFPLLPNSANHPLVKISKVSRASTGCVKICDQFLAICGNNASLVVYHSLMSRWQDNCRAIGGRALKSGKEPGRH